MKPYAYILRGIAEHVGLSTVQQIATAPGVKAVYRVTMYYMDIRTSSVVATLIQTNDPDARLEVVYQGRFENKPLVSHVQSEQFNVFARLLREVKFDRLPDQEDIPVRAVDLCLIERGANGFVRGVIFTPDEVSGDYAVLYAAVKQYLPQVLREI